MKGYIMTITYYRNKDNENKYIAVKRTKDGHYYYFPFMYHKKAKFYPYGLLNPIDSKRQCYHRCTLSRFIIPIVHSDYEKLSGLYISSKVNTFKKEGR